MKKIFLLLSLCLFTLAGAYSQSKTTDANIIGHVVSKDVHLTYITVSIKGTTIGTVTDETGHFQLINVPIAYSGFTISDARLMGYGMDIDEKWRNLPYIVKMKNE